MKLRADLFDEALQTHIDQERPRKHQGIGEDNGNPIRDGAAQDNQGECRRLQGEVEDPEGHAGKATAILPPQLHDEQRTDNVYDDAEENNRSHVQNDHFRTSVSANIR